MVTLLLLACAGVSDADVRPVDSSGAETDAPDTGDSGADTDDSADTDDTVDTDDSGDTDTAVIVDADGDGWSPPEDCDDTRASTHPGAFDQCDTIDQDCDGLPIAPGACAEQGSVEAGTLWLVSHPGVPSGGTFLTGDVTGDGQPDLLEMTVLDYTVFPGGAVPETPWQMPAEGYHSIVDVVYGAAVHEFEAGDVDGDGIEDLGLISTFEDQGVHFFLGPFDGGGATSMTGDHIYADPDTHPDDYWGNPTYGALDFDGDGRADLIADNSDSLDWTYSIYFGGEWDTLCLLGETTNGHIRIVEDIDGDGLTDLFLEGRPTGFVSGLELRSSCDGPVGHQEFAWQRSSDENWGQTTNIGDWNGDGWDDLAIADSSSDRAGTNAGEIYFLTGPFAGEMSLEDAIGSWVGRAAGDGLGSSVSALDFDGDGTRDLLVDSGPLQEGVCRGGTFPSSAEPLPACLLTEYIPDVPWHRSNDFDGDGFDDLFIQSADGTLAGIFPGFAVPWDDPSYW